MFDRKGAWSSVDVIWTERGVEHAAEHEVTVEQANEDLDDVDAIEADPDPRTEAGHGIRRIGYSPSRGRVVTVIVLRVEDSLFPATAFPITGADLRTFIDMTTEQADQDADELVDEEGDEQ